MFNTGNTAIDLVMNWAKTLFFGFTQATEWLTTPLFNLSTGENFSALTLLTFGGLTAFLTVAVVKWVIS